MAHAAMTLKRIFTPHDSMCCDFRVPWQAAYRPRTASFPSYLLRLNLSSISSIPLWCYVIPPCKQESSRRLVPGEILPLQLPDERASAKSVTFAIAISRLDSRHRRVARYFERRSANVRSDDDVVEREEGLAVRRGRDGLRLEAVETFRRQSIRVSGKRKMRTMASN